MWSTATTDEDFRSRRPRIGGEGTSERKEPFPADEPAALKPVAAGDRWAARYHIGDYDGAPDAALDGIVYVYTSGKRHHESVSGTRHYGIVYSLRIRERVLQANSELWMGPILVPSNFQYVAPSRITMQEWLDVNPIPEITGENTTDPTLLGVPEHIGKGAKLEAGDKRSGGESK